MRSIRRSGNRSDPEENLHAAPILAPRFEKRSGDLPQGTTANCIHQNFKNVATAHRRISQSLKHSWCFRRVKPLKIPKPPNLFHSSSNEERETSAANSSGLAESGA